MDSYKYSFKNTIKENLSLAVYNAGYQKCDGMYKWGPAVRDHYLVHYVSEGKGKLIVNQQEITVNKGEMFLIYPTQLVSYIADEKEPWEYYWVGFNGTEAKRMINLTGFTREYPIVRSSDTTQAKKLLLNIYQACGNTSAADAGMIGYLYLFLSCLIEQANIVPKSIETKEYLEKAVRFIQYNYAGDIRVNDIARYVGISRSQLYRAFLEQFSLSPTVFLQHYRINEACSLLHHPGLSISEVACSVGFNDPLYFSRSFKKIKGVSPSEYRINQ